MKPSEIRRDQDAFVLSFLTIRRTIGFLGIFLPLALLTGCAIFGGCGIFQNSISHFYFTVMGDVFVGTLCAVALFLITYKGYDRHDSIVTSLAGIAALGVAFFATDNIKDCSTVLLNDYTARIVTHYTCAGMFFVSLAYMSYFRFTKTKDDSKTTSRKVSRNVLYRVCAIVMVICIGLVFSTKLYKEVAADYNLVFWFEWLALLAFGISWLTKGEFLILKDVEEKKTVNDA